MSNISPIFDYVPFDKWISKEDMVIGKLYLCRARNFNQGRWNGSGFDYIRSKFGFTYPAVEYHWDDGAPFGTVKPFKVIEEPDDE